MDCGLLSGSGLRVTKTRGIATKSILKVTPKQEGYYLLLLHMIFTRQFPLMLCDRKILWGEDTVKVIKIPRDEYEQKKNQAAEVNMRRKFYVRINRQLQDEINDVILGLDSSWLVANKENERPKALDERVANAMEIKQECSNMLIDDVVKKEYIYRLLKEQGKLTKAPTPDAMSCFKEYLSTIASTEKKDSSKISRDI